MPVQGLYLCLGGSGLVSYLKVSWEILESAKLTQGCVNKVLPGYTFAML